MGITVNELLSKGFINRTREQKEKIVTEGKPRPTLERLASVDNKYSSISGDSTICDSNKFVIVFDVASYDHVEWMTGCDIRQALFCWPCLLFRSGHQTDPWTSSGITDLNDLREKINAHEKDLVHIQSMLDLHVFSLMIKVPAPLAPPEESPDLFEKNREMAKRIIDVICYLVTQQKHPRIGSRDKNVLEVEDCLENLHFLRDYDILHVQLIDDTVKMIQENPKIISDMIEAINSTVKMSFQKELHQSTYAALILCEHSLEPAKSQISTVVRYLKNGQVCERFLGLTNVDGPKSHVTVFQHIDKIITKFQISRRVMAYSLDSSVLITIQALNDLKQELLYSHPYMHFIPCHFHDLDYVLQKCLSYSRECDAFFKGLIALGTYFLPGTKMWQCFQNYIADEIPNVDNFHATNFAGFLCSIKTYRLYIIGFFVHTVSSNDRVTASDMVKINGLRSFLTDFKTVFLLETFIRLFDLAAPLVEAFKSPVPGVAFDANLIDSVLKSFDNEIQNGTYEVLWNQVSRDFDELQKLDPNSNAKISFSKKFTCQRIFSEVTQIMKQQISYRFENAKILSFCRILDFENSATSGQNKEHLQTLKTAYGYNYSVSLLEKEIKLMIMNKSAMNTDSVHGIYELLVKSGLVNSFPIFTKICELVLTMPSTVPSKDRPSKLEVLKSWSYRPGKHEISRDITLLCVEQEYLKELKGRPSFYNEVMKQFQEKTKAKVLRLFAPE